MGENYFNHEIVGRNNLKHYFYLKEHMMIKYIKSN